MSQPTKKPEVRFVFPEARRLKREGYADEHIVSALIARGANPEEARSVVSQLRESDASAVRSEVYKQIAVSVVIAILGFVLMCSGTAVSSKAIGGALLAIIVGGGGLIHGIVILVKDRM